MTNRFDNLSEQEKARLQQAEKKAGATSFPFLVVKDGGFITGKKPNEIDMTGAEFVALIDLASAGWSCFKNGKKLDEVMVELMRDSTPPRPATFTDELDWKFGTYGPEDPWSFSWELPLRDAANRVLLFKARSEITRKLVAGLLTDFRKTWRRPIIRLLIEPASGGKRLPKFMIIGHDESDDADALMTAKRPEDADTNSDGAGDSSSSTTNGTAPPRNHRSDMDDDIPF